MVSELAGNDSVCCAEWEMSALRHPDRSEAESRDLEANVAPVALGSGLSLREPRNDGEV